MGSEGSLEIRWEFLGWEVLLVHSSLYAALKTIVSGMFGVTIDRPQKCPGSTLQNRFIYVSLNRVKIQITIHMTSPISICL